MHDEEFWHRVEELAVAGVAGAFVDVRAEGFGEEAGGGEEDDFEL